MGAPAEHRWTPGERLPDGRWAPGTLVRTPRDEYARVLPYGPERPDQAAGDAVFVQPLARPERPWQLWGSSELTAMPDGPTGSH